MPRIAAQKMSQIVEDADRDETREEKFSRLANRRVNHILHHVQTFTNLSNRGSYAYTDAQVEGIFEVIQAAIDEAQARFKPRRKPEFRL
jgi:hypothetical protein